MKQKIIVFVILVLLAFIPITYNACDPFSKDVSSATATIAGNPIETASILPYFPLQFHTGCLAEVLYMNQNGDEFREVLTPRVINFDPNGTELDDLPIPSTPFTFITLIFAPVCDSTPGKSLSYTKNNGSLVFDQVLAFHFRGLYDKSTMPNSELFFNFQNFFDLFESSPDSAYALQVLPFIHGSFGPLTQVRSAPHSYSQDQYRGCLTGVYPSHPTGVYANVFKPRFIEFSDTGVDLGTIGISMGNYDLAVMLFESRCPEMTSAFEVTNSYGTFQIQRPDLIMYFGGSFLVPDQRSLGIVFDFSPIFNAYSGARSQTQMNNIIPRGTFGAGQ